MQVTSSYNGTRHSETGGVLCHQCWRLQCLRLCTFYCAGTGFHHSYAELFRLRCGPGCRSGYDHSPAPPSAVTWQKRGLSLIRGQSSFFVQMKKSCSNQNQNRTLVVEMIGIEPTTSWMPFKRSPKWATPPSTLIVYHRILQIASSFFFLAKIIKWQNVQINCYFFINIEYDLGDRKVTRFMHKSRRAPRYCHSNPFFWQRKSFIIQFGISRRQSASHAASHRICWFYEMLKLSNQIPDFSSICRLNNPY